MPSQDNVQDIEERELPREFEGESGSDRDDDCLSREDPSNRKQPFSRNQMLGPARSTANGLGESQYNFPFYVDES